MSDKRVQGLHHVTSIASDPQRNVDFYTKNLGLRLVKKTVNFDDTSTYHLYYGNEVGEPGTILTFFPFGTGYKGEPGKGQPTATSFTIPENSTEYWISRFDEMNIERGTPEERFGQEVIPFKDVDGQHLELVTGDSDVESWKDGPIDPSHAIRGFHSVTLHSADPEATGTVLDLLGYERVGKSDERIRYETTGERGRVIDVLNQPNAPPGRPGAGTVHHLAFRTPNEETQLTWRDRLREASLPLRVTPVKDRQYFKSVYFREPGGVLFEIATEGPGFNLDEPVEALGSELKLPHWLEDDRNRLKANLPEITDRSKAD